MFWLRASLALLALNTSALSARADVGTDSLRASLVIEQLADAHNFRFLYRDALLRDLWAPARPSLAEFIEHLEAHGVVVQVDTVRGVILLLEQTERPGRSSTVVQGRVVDDASGAVLSHATIFWRQDGALTGTTTSADGSFRLTADTSEPVLLTVSYVGYEPRQFHVRPGGGSLRLTVRLRQTPVPGREVVVVGSMLQSSLDTSWHHLMRPKLYAPFGEANLIRSLSLLPAAAVAPAGAEGLHLRGSPSDAVHVLLDGITIYNHGHLFGLFDAFNSDALHSVGLYYDGTPARYDAPSGGLMAFETRSGSLLDYRAQAGLSNTAGRLTLEGPLRKGRTSFLVSGRRSIVNTFNWFNNEQLIAYGLNLERETSVVAPEEDGRLAPSLDTESEASFYDLHVRVYLQSDAAKSWSASGYLGGNSAAYSASRLLVQRPSAGLRRLPVTADQRWGNAAASLRHTRLVGSTALQMMLGISHYTSRFAREDFRFYRADSPGGGFTTIEDFFRQDNQLTEWKADATASSVVTDRLTAEWGATLRRFDQRYSESSAVRPLYDRLHSVIQADGSADATWQQSDRLEIRSGLRALYYSSGNRAVLAPRARGHLRLTGGLSTSVAYSRSYQFIHRLVLEGVGAPPFWMLSNREDSPSIGDHVSAGIYLTPSDRFAIQMEIFHKHTRNVRDHQVDVPLWRTPETYSGSPVVTDLTSRARGMEVMARSRAGAALMTAAYTLSHAELWSVRGGSVRYAAPWDRRHQFTGTVEVRAAPGLSVDATVVAASGAPNNLTLALSSEPERLAAYRRVDTGITFTPHDRMEMTVAVFNVFARSNTWYRETRPLIQDRGLPRVVGSTTVDVFDFGRRPSFDLRLRL
ncbi:MAG: TonB-dependent receptor [Bacteroidota bacterium]